MGATGGAYQNIVLPANVRAGLLAANSPSAANPFATMADIPAPAVTIYSGNGTVGAGRQATVTDTLHFITAGTGGLRIGATAFISTSTLHVKNTSNNAMLVDGFTATSASDVQAWRDSAATVLATVRSDGRWGFNVAPATADRFTMTVGNGLTGGINMSALNLVTGGYGILIQGSTSGANYNGLWSDAQGGTGVLKAVFGNSGSSGSTENYGGYFSARNATSITCALYGDANGGDAVDPSFAAIGVQGSVRATVALNRRAGYFWTDGNVNNGITYTLKAEGTASGTNAVNYGLHARINGNGASVTNYAGWFQADGTTSATNYAIVTNGGNVGFGTTTPSNQALLELSSTTQAFLLMRMTGAQASLITPANGMQLYATATDATFTTTGFWKYANGAWVTTPTATGAFTQGSVIFAGPSGVLAQDNSMFFWDDTNNIIYVGANSGAYTNSKAHFQANVNSYSQVNSINTSAGNSASTDFICTADNGTDSTNYVDFGINSSTYNDAAYTIVGVNDSYIYSNGGNLAMGTQSAKDIVFHTNGTLAANRRMTIRSSGQVLINTTTDNPTALGIVRIAQGTSTIDMGERTAATAGIWFVQVTPSTTNHALQGTLNATQINATTSTTIAVAGIARISAAATAISFTPGAATSGVLNPFLFTIPASTGQTASTESIGFNYSYTSTRQWATGALALQREFMIGVPSYRFVGASTITDAVNLAIAGAPSAGTNATITNSHAVRINSTNVVNGGTAVTNSYGLTCNAQTGATNNYSAQFLGGAVVLAAGTTTYAPLTLIAGTNRTTASAGDFEYDGTNLFFTRTGTTREGILVGNASAVAPSTSAGVAIANYYGTSATNYLGDPVVWFTIIDNAGVSRKVPAY